MVALIHKLYYIMGHPWIESFLVLNVSLGRVYHIYQYMLISNFYIRKSNDYVYGIWVYKVHGIWKGYCGVKKITGFMHETVNRGKKQ